MRKVYDVTRGDEKLSHYINEDTKKVLVAFFHGIGDAIMFIEVFEQLKRTYPDIHFDAGLCAGLGQEELIPDAVFLGGDWREKAEETDAFDHYDIVFSCNFPMNEGQTELTKGQFSCVKELGIEPNEMIYSKLPCSKNRLIAVQFHITCLPDSCNPDRDTAERIWNDILEEGFIPIEMHFSHIFNNPANKKFDFIDCTVRRVKPQISTLAGLIDSCAGVVSVVTGNLHVALANIPHEKIFFLEKDFKLESFIKSDKIKKADVKDYKGEIRDWLKTL